MVPELTNEHELDDGRQRLEQSGSPPCPVVVDILRAKGDPRADKRTDVPQAVVDGSDATTVLRVADLSQKHGSRKLGQGVAETHEEASALEHGLVDGGSLDSSRKDHDDTAADDGQPPAEVVA